VPADSNVLQWLAAASEVGTTRNASAVGIRPTDEHVVAWSDTKVLFEYRRGDFADTIRERFFPGSAARLATFSLIQAMGTRQLKDYWGAMMSWTRAYTLVQAGASQGLVALTARSEIFPGISEPDYLQAPWYDWAVAALLLREWDEIVGEAERSVSRMPGGAPSLEQIALIRAVGQWHALRCEWSGALRCSQSCLQSNQGDSLDHATMDYEDFAVACLQLGDRNGYLRLREEMASRFKDPDERTAERALTVGLMQSLDDQAAVRLEPSAALLLARTLANGNETPTYPILLGLLEYRRGHYTKAIEWVQRSLPKLPNVALPNAMDRVILAMSLHQIGNRSAAHLELERAKNLIATGFDLEFDVWHWRDWVFLRLLLREANALMSQAPLLEPDSAPR